MVLIADLVLSRAKPSPTAHADFLQFRQDCMNDFIAT
jgi:hypothetical protein